VETIDHVQRAARQAAQESKVGSSAQSVSKSFQRGRGVDVNCGMQKAPRAVLFLGQIKPVGYATGFPFPGLFR
jgi:hypothetical protein